MTQPRLDLVVTTCGKKKYQGPAVASQFYTGPFAQKQMAAARALNPVHGYRVLSNVYGFLHPTRDVVPGPYNSHWGYPDTLAQDKLQAQADAIGIKEGGIIAVMGARVYAEKVREVFPSSVIVIWVPNHLPKKGMGYQSQMLGHIITFKGLPRACFTECRVVN